jgi:hypothetical protein
MTNKAQIFCAISGPVGALLFGAGLFAAGFLPPTPPLTSIEDILTLYREHTTGIRLCGIAMYFLLAALMTQYTGLSDQIRRIDAPQAKTWAAVQVTLGGISLVPVYGVGICWQVATYRLERAPEVTLMLNDMGWFYLVTPVAPALIQMFAAGFGTLADKSPTPLFPRWYSYFSFWVGVLLMTGLLVPFFMTGPWAWNGLLSFWVAASALGTWLNVTGVLMVKVARRQVRAAAHSSDAEYSSGAAQPRSA